MRCWRYPGPWGAAAQLIVTRASGAGCDLCVCVYVCTLLPALQELALINAGDSRVWTRVIRLSSPVLSCWELSPGLVSGSPGCYHSVAICIAWPSNRFAWSCRLESPPDWLQTPPLLHGRLCPHAGICLFNLTLWWFCLCVPVYYTCTWPQRHCYL